MITRKRTTTTSTATTTITNINKNDNDDGDNKIIIDLNIIARTMAINYLFQLIYS